MEDQECTRWAGRNARKLGIEGEKALVAAKLAAVPKRVQKRLKRIGSGKTGSWLTVVPERRNDTLLSMEKMRDNLSPLRDAAHWPPGPLQQLRRRVLGGPHTEVQKGRPCLHPAQRCAQ